MYLYNRGTKNSRILSQGACFVPRQNRKFTFFLVFCFLYSTTIENPSKRYKTGILYFVFCTPLGPTLHLTLEFLHYHDIYAILRAPM